MDLLSYLDFTWIGEGRNNDRSPGHHLIEVSVISLSMSSQIG